MRLMLLVLLLLLWVEMGVAVYLLIGQDHTWPRMTLVGLVTLTSFALIGLSWNVISMP